MQFNNVLLIPSSCNINLTIVFSYSKNTAGIQMISLMARDKFQYFSREINVKKKIRSTEKIKKKFIHTRVLLIETFTSEVKDLKKKKCSSSHVRFVYFRPQRAFIIGGKVFKLIFFDRRRDILPGNRWRVTFPNGRGESKKLAALWAVILVGATRARVVL